MSEDRYCATFVGCALGDTLGMPIEGWKREQIQKYLTKITEPLDPLEVIAATRNDQDIKRYHQGLKKGEFTDDTILTIAVAESLIKNKTLNIRDMAKRQLEAYEHRILPDGSVKGGFGKTTIKAFMNLQKRMKPQESGIEGKPGIGPAMKMSPVGLYMDATDKYEIGLIMAEAIGQITHLDSRSVTAGIVQAHAIYSLLKDCSREEFLKFTIDVVKRHEKRLSRTYPPTGGALLNSQFIWISRNKDAKDEEAYNKLGCSSLVYQSYPFTIFMFQKYWDNPIEGLIETVNFGGDCDTTGAIYGALCGAKNGMIFPREWTECIDNAPLIKLGTKMFNLKTAKK